MKNKNCRNIINATLLALAVPVGVASAGTAEVTAPPPADGCLDWIKISGYAAVTATWTDDGDTTLGDAGTPYDALKVVFEGSQGPFGEYVSLFYTPGVPGDDGGILDAYVTYKTGPLTFTAGKYLSWLGYEAFDAVNMNQITYAAGIGAIPAYHSGLKVDYVTDVFSAGFNVSDSIMGGNGFWTGDGDFGDGLGYEGYVAYKGVPKLTLWAGFGYEEIDDETDWVTYDVWASYDLTDKLNLAAELVYHEDPGVEGYQGLLYAKYSFTDKFSLVGRWGFALPEDESEVYSYTICPSYSFCKDFLVRGELTYYDESSGGSDLFAGVQAILKF